MATYKQHIGGTLGYGPGCEHVPGAEPGLTRRRLLVLAAAAAASAAIWPGALTQTHAAPAPGAAAANAWGRSAFLPHVGEPFLLAAPQGGQTIRARLDAVMDLSWKPGSASAGSEDGFVLIFRGPASPRLGQDVLRVRHPVLGTLDLFIFPAGPGVAAGQDYAAVINRLTPPS